MPDLKISDFVDGGTVKYTDEIAAVRGGVNTKVFVGTAASQDIGTSPNDIPTNAMIPGSLADSFYGTSTTENTIGTGTQSFVTQAGKAFGVGRYLLVVDATNPDTNQMSGIVSAYDEVTGDLDIDVTTVVGSGTIDDWIIYLSGPTGQNGTDGDNAWSPVLAVVSDGARRVFQVVDWVGGEGTKPATGLYVGATGLEADIADAVDVRGPQGPAGDGGTAADVDYDNTASGLAAINVQQAIDELVLLGVNDLGSVSGSIEIDLDDGRAVELTMSGNITFTDFINPTTTGNEDSFTIYLERDASSNVTWPASVIPIGDEFPELVANTKHLFVLFTIDAGTVWYLSGGAYS